jgi:hypothetical protein
MNKIIIFKKKQTPYFQYFQERFHYAFLALSSAEILINNDKPITNDVTS